MSMADFRQGLRAIGVTTADDDEFLSDDLFRVLDPDNSNDLDFEEFEGGLAVLREQLIKTEKQRMSAAADRAEAEYWRQKSELIQEAVEKTESADAAEKELADLTDQGALDQRVGMLLFTKGLTEELFPHHGHHLTTSDMLHKLKDMRSLRHLGMDVTDKELHALLREIDLNGEGQLSLQGLNAAIKRSHETMTTMRQKIKEVRSFYLSYQQYPPLNHDSPLYLARLLPCNADASLFTCILQVTCKWSELRAAASDSQTKNRKEALAASAEKDMIQKIRDEAEAREKG